MLEIFQGRLLFIQNRAKASQLTEKLTGLTNLSKRILAL